MALPIPLSGAHIRIARPTDNINGLLSFYRDGLGFKILGKFSDHEGFDGIMLGLEGAHYHLEFTHKKQHKVGGAPTQDNLLIFYLPENDIFNAAVERMENYGFKASTSFNPYWDRCGKTFFDPDGYGIVLANMANPVLKSTTPSGNP